MFLRDKACIIGYTRGAYYKEPDKITSCLEQGHNLGMRCPIDSSGRWDENFRSKNFTYFEHHDPSVSHDAYAISLGHVEGDKIIIDLAHQILPKLQGGEIDTEELIAFCQMLHDRFPNVAKITYDTWAASALMQNFTKKGLVVENLYIKKAQHDLLKEKFYSGNILSYKNAILEKELRELELSGDKVDHPISGSKDVADSVAGVVWNCIQNPGAGISAAMAVKKSDDDGVVTKSGFKILTMRRPKIWELSRR
jgi:hypothetical protein